MNPAWAEVAERLRVAEERRDPVPPVIADWPALTTADAYNIQRVNIDRRVAAGESVVGHKVGLSSKAMQQMMGVDEPDYGHLLADMEVADGGVDGRDGLHLTRVEVEVAFVLGAPLAGPDCTDRRRARRHQGVAPGDRDHRQPDRRLADRPRRHDRRQRVVGRFVLGDGSPSRPTSTSA